MSVQYAICAGVPLKRQGPEHQLSSWHACLEIYGLYEGLWPSKPNSLSSVVRAFGVRGNDYDTCGSSATFAAAKIGAAWVFNAEAG